jgi:NifU-like protein involved in Fe-S cluster formation
LAGSPLYTHEVLALATSLSQWPPQADLPLVGQARSPTCGSTLTVQLETGRAGQITALGLQAKSCAIGQASAALFAQAALGRTGSELAAALETLRAWLKGEGDLPAWPGLAAIAPARGYPARHGAVTLPWEAALDALSSAAKPG